MDTRIDEIESFAEGVTFVNDRVKRGQPCFSISRGEDGEYAALTVGSFRIIKVGEEGFLMCISLSPGQLEYIRDKCQQLLDAGPERN